MSIQRYEPCIRQTDIDSGFDKYPALKKSDIGRCVLFSDHEAELHHLLSTLDDFRTALGVGDKPMLSELATDAARLRRERDEAVEALRELHALVLGECPSLLNEDSGGDARLDMAIDAVLAGHAPEPDHIADLRKMVSDRERRLQRIRASKGDRVIHLDPVTAAVGQNEYEGGYLVVVDSQCRTEKYRILSNTGPSIGVPLVVLLAEELRFDIGELSDVSLEKARAALAGTTEDAS